MDGLAGERRDALLAALAFAAHVSAVVEGDVGAGQAGELGDPQTGLDREEQQGVVAAPEPTGAVGCGPAARRSPGL